MSNMHPIMVSAIASARAAELLHGAVEANRLARIRRAGQAGSMGEEPPGGALRRTVTWLEGLFARPRAPRRRAWVQSH